jgi:hypothetical protein
MMVVVIFGAGGAVVAVVVATTVSNPDQPTSTNVKMRRKAPMMRPPRPMMPHQRAMNALLLPFHR